MYYNYYLLMIFFSFFYLGEKDFETWEAFSTYFQLKID